jgi:PhnB protein
MYVQPYLYFDGRTEEALKFYEKAVGAKIDVLMRFSEAPPMDPSSTEGCAGGPPPSSAEKIMHCSFHIGDTEILASDGMCAGKATFAGISLAIQADTVDQAKKYFAALGEGGQVQMPMTATFFAEAFGMVADKFGVSWMVLGGPKQP